jgi:hypothetical protein
MPIKCESRCETVSRNFFRQSDDFLLPHINGAVVQLRNIFKRSDSCADIRNVW